MSNSELHKVSKEIALLTLEISYLAKTGHVGSALSIVDILTVLYFTQLNVTLENLSSEKRDRFILSKGHAAAALYATLYKKGILSKKKLYSFGSDEGGLCEHTEIEDTGIEMTSGSLGHGLGFGVGIALGMKLATVKSQVYVLISDGECGEGSVWESAYLASKLRLDNLTVIIDNNKWQCFGKVSDITNITPFRPKWESFGWHVEEIEGHDTSAIRNSFQRIKLVKEKPHVIIANTVSGKGISMIEDKLIGHYKVFTDEEYVLARKEIEQL